MLHDSLTEYARGQGAWTLEDILQQAGADVRYLQMARAQDQIGWRRFMEGMISREIVVCQEIGLMGDDTGN